MYLADHHIHSCCSPDSEAPLSEMLRAAQAAALSDLCATDHCDLLDLDGGRVTGLDWAPILTQYQAARGDCPAGVKLRLGLELGGAPVDPDCAAAILSGAEPIYVPLHPPEFSFNPNELEDAFRQNPKALILCNPSNPCGKVFTRQELETIAQLAVKYDTYVITDEVYEHIVYAPNVHTYFATLPGMWERTISCSSLSKTYSITGWRLGYIIAPPEIIDVAKKVHDFLTVGAAAPLQEAAVTGLRFGPEYYKWLQDKYTGKRDLFLQGLRDLKIPHTEPQGAYYVMLDISEFGFDSDLEFCEVLARDVGVGAVPGSSFFREPVNHLIRLHFAKKDDTLTEALNRLADLRKKIPARK